MKVISLEIHELRGIRHQVINLNKNNISIYGPNGSGKSGVVDALDFLLTGKIARLTGEGTSGFSLLKYGKHIEADINDSYVKSSIFFDGIRQTVELTRYLNKPDELLYDRKYQEVVEPILELAGRGHYVLTRKNLLKYIVAKSGDRSKEIQALLNIDEIEDVRAALKNYINNNKKELKNAETNLRNSENDLVGRCGCKKFTKESVIDKINQLREVVNGDPLTRLSSECIVNGVRLPESSSGKPSMNTTTLLSDCNILSRFVLSDVQKELRLTLETFHQATKLFLTDPKNRRLVNLRNFIEDGIRLLDDSGSCPLCDTEWLPEELREFLNDKFIKSQEQSSLFNEIETIGETPLRELNKVTNALKSLLGKIPLLPGETTVPEKLRLWQDRIDRTINIIRFPHEPQNLIDLSNVLDANWITPEYVPSLLEEIQGSLESKKIEITPEQKAWDTLNQLKSVVSTWEKHSNQATEKKLILERSQKFLTSFIESRDVVLNGLINSISSRFVSLYKAMHGDDEKEFTADISLTDTGMNFTVDFYGKGKEPPQALHSEGHQDSMGICLYLALAEKLTGGVFNFIVLDDVLMSVDADHRRQFSKMLRNEFPDIQFVITTHDRIWANQLRNDGVVSKINSVEFTDWTIELGPSVSNEDSEDWEKIYELVRSNNISQASAKLRKASEQFFASVCERLEGKVVYRSGNQRSLGELGSSIETRYKSLLRDSKKSYDSWGRSEESKNVAVISKEFHEICKTKEIEQWAINPTTHYNEWATLSKNDFLPIIDAFKRFFECFKCPKCGSIIELSKSNYRNVGLCCSCKNINLNLELNTKRSN